MYIRFKDLEALCNSDSHLIALIDKIKLTKFKVSYNIVNDLDFFSYPQKFLNDKVKIEDSDSDNMNEDKNLPRNIKIKSMKSALIEYSKKVADNKASWPPALMQIK